MLCSRCAPIAPQACVHCGRERRVAPRWHEGPVCAACYRRALAAKSGCPGCGLTRRLMTYPGWETKVCASCAGAAPLSVCEHCGTEDALYRRGRCPACSLHLALEETLGDPAARAANGLAPVFDRLVELEQPRWVLDWLRRGTSAAILARFATGQLSLDHHAFDQLPAGPAWFIERLLVTVGARVERWTADHLASIGNPDRRRAARPLQHMAGAAPAAREKRRQSVERHHPQRSQTTA